MSRRHVLELEREKEDITSVPVNGQAILPFSNDGGDVVSEFPRQGGKHSKLHLDQKTVLPSVSTSSEKPDTKPATKSVSAAVHPTAAAVKKRKGQIVTSKTADIAEAFIPADFWNHVVAKHVDQTSRNEPTVAEVQDGRQPFGRLAARQYMFEKVNPMVKESQAHAHRANEQQKIFSKLAPAFDALDDKKVVRPEAAPTRSEALLLQQAFDVMTSNLRNEFGGQDPCVLAKQAAMHCQPHDLLRSIEPEFYVLDVVMTELVKQVRVGCAERGRILEQCRTRILDMFATTSLGLQQISYHWGKEKTEKERVQQTVNPVSLENDELRKRVAAMDLEVRQYKATLQQLEKTLSALQLGEKKAKDDNSKTRSSQDQKLADELREAEDIKAVLQSKINILEQQVRYQMAQEQVLKLQIEELQARVRKDAETLEEMGENVARAKVRLAWMRAIAFARKAPKEVKDAQTQDGDGLPNANITIRPLYRESTPPDVKAKRDAERAEQEKSRVVGKEFMHGQLVAYSAFWAGVVKQAEASNLENKARLQMSKKELLEFTAKIYTEKILCDEVDDRSKLGRQTLPEFLYDYYLETLGEPQLAEEALVSLICNVRVFDTSSLRVRMFSRFLNLGGQPYPLEALNIFLGALVKIQNGQLPLLPSNEMHVDAARGMRVIEFIFAQAPYVVRSKVLLEAEKKATGRHIDLDQLLQFIVEQWKEEAGRAEERLRALFVASDMDGDGNLDFTEFTAMVHHVNSNKGHRELLRMYAEMTLNKTVECNTFVRVCRKFRFFTFEVGPAVKRQDPAAAEVFALLVDEWSKIEDVVHELLVVLEGTPVANRLEQHVVVLKKKLQEKLDVEETWHCYRNVVAQFTSAVKNRTAKEDPA